MRASRKGGRARLALVIGFCTLLAACGSSGIEVEREAHLPANSAGASFMMLDARGQDADPRHARAADLVAAELTARHFVRVTEPAQARFAVMVWDRSREARPAEAPSGESSSSSYQGRGRGGMGGPGGTGGRGGRMGGGPLPTEGAPASRAERRVEIQIYDLTQRGPGQHVFNATARLDDPQARGTGTAEMIAAALRDFPGRPRESFSVPATR